MHCDSGIELLCALLLLAAMLGGLAHPLPCLGSSRSCGRQQACWLLEDSMLRQMQCVAPVAQGPLAAWSHAVLLLQVCLAGTYMCWASGSMQILPDQDRAEQRDSHRLLACQDLPGGRRCGCACTAACVCALGWGGLSAQFPHAVHRRRFRACPVCHYSAPEGAQSISQQQGCMVRRAHALGLLV